MGGACREMEARLPTPRACVHQYPTDDNNRHSNRKSDYPHPTHSRSRSCPGGTPPATA